MELGLLFFFLFLAAALLVVAAKTIRVVPQATVMIVERLGRFHKLADSGLHVFVPFIDKPRSVYWAGLGPGLSSIDLREQFIDMPPQLAITRDNVQIEVDAVVFWQITDPLDHVKRLIYPAGRFSVTTVGCRRGFSFHKNLPLSIFSQEFSAAP
jgi:regulator of protease activity HflC (stomatin/prohibitin superfamily)